MLSAIPSMQLGRLRHLFRCLVMSSRMLVLLRASLLLGLAQLLQDPKSFFIWTDYRADPVVSRDRSCYAFLNSSG